MPTTIDSLELEIISSSQSAESGLSRLVATLGQLKVATKGGLGLSAVAKNLTSMSAAVNSMSSAGSSNIIGLARAMELLGSTKISSTVATQITAVSTALRDADFSSGGAKVTELVTALQPLQSLGSIQLTPVVTALRRLPEVLNSIDTRKLYTQINSLTRIFRPFATEMQKIAAGFASFPANIQQMVTGMNRLNTATTRVTATNKRASLSFINLYARMSMYIMIIRRIGSAIASAITEMNDYIENLNLFNASMGEFASSAQEYAEKVGEVMGIDPGEWMRNQGVFMTLATGFGVAGDRAAIMSQQLTQLGYDLSSFFNISFEDSMQKLQSGLAGELEPLRRLGYDLSQAKLAEVALSLGIDKKVASMNQAEKAQLRYYAIMTQVTVAQGDMARTLDAPANQLRIFKAQVTQAARAIGGIFIPILNKILPYAIAAAKVIRYLAAAIASLFGFELPEVDYSGLDVVTSGAEDASDALDKATESAKKLKSYTLGFDELNVFEPNSDSGSGGGSGSSGASGGGGLDFELPTYDFLGEVTESRIAQIVEDMKEWLGITDDITSWSDLMDTRFGSILKTVGLIAGGLIAWKLTTGFMTAVTALKTLLANPFYKITLSAILTFAGFALEFSSIKKAIEEGLSKLNYQKILGGGILGAGGSVALGGAIASWISTAFEGSAVATALTSLAAKIGVSSAGAAGAAVAGSFGAIIAGIPMFIYGIYESIKNGITELSAGLVAFGGGLAGTGIGAIIGMAVGTIGGPLGAAVGALIGMITGVVIDLVILIVQKWDEIVAWTKKACDAIGKFFSDLWSGIKSVWNVVATWFDEKVITPVANFFSGLWNGVKDLAISVWDGIVNVYTKVAKWFDDNLIKPVSKFFTDLWNGIKSAASACWDGIKSFFSPAFKWFSELFGSIKTTLSDIFYNIGVIAKGCWEIIKAAWNVASTWFNDTVITPVKTFFTDLWDSIKSLAISAWDGIKNVYKTIETWFDLHIITPISEFFTNLWQGIKDGAVAAWDGIKTTYSKVKTWFNDNLITPVSKFFVELWDGFVSKAKSAWEGVKTVFSKVASFFKTTFENAWAGVVKVFSAAGNVFLNIKDGIVSAFKAVVNTLIKGINKVVAVPFNGINSALNTLKNIKILDLTPFSGIRSISVPSIPLLAQGGFPDVGQMFIAREAGAELVGNIGGRTAVVNNDQIVDSVSTGVYQAVVAAMSGNNDGGDTQIVINLDGEKIYENQQRVARNRGYNLGMGAFSFG